MNSYVLCLLLPQASLIFGLLIPSSAPKGNPVASTHTSAYAVNPTSTPTAPTATATISGPPSVESRLAQMEQTITNLQTQAQATDSQISALKAKLTLTEDELKLAQDKVTVTGNDLLTAQSDIKKLTVSLQNSPDPSQFGQLVNELSSLRAAFLGLQSHFNSTAIDALGVDVKSNIKKLQMINSQLSTNNRNINQMLDDTARHTLEIENLTSEVLTLSECACSNGTDLATALQGLEALEANVSEILNSITSRQNVTEQELTATDALLQSALSDLVVLQSQVSNESATGDVNVTQDLSAVMDLLDQLTKDVAFEVSQDSVKENWTTLKFDTVEYNKGSAYSETTGMFTAPVPGTYLFWAHIKFHWSSNNYIYIKKGAQTLATAYAQTARDYHVYYGVASVTTVTHLDAGEQVHFATSSEHIQVVGFKESSYGGVLIRAT